MIYYLIVTIVLSTLRVNSDERPDASLELPGPSGTYPYLLLAGCPARDLPAPTLVLASYATVAPAL